MIHVQPSGWESFTFNGTPLVISAENLGQAEARTNAIDDVTSAHYQCMVPAAMVEGYRRCLTKELL